MKIFRSLKQLTDHIIWQLGRERQSHQALRQGHARGKPGIRLIDLAQQQGYILGLETCLSWLKSLLPEPDCKHSILLLTLGDDRCYYWECEDCLMRIPADEMTKLQPGILGDEDDI